jgi:hypothetical protein
MPIYSEGVIMESETKKLSSREKDEAATQQLQKLQEQLQSPDASNRRRAAFNLSWMQEDGLEILKGALYGGSQVTTKNAAAYGLRKMRGRMKKMALEVLKEGLKHRDSSTREVSRNAMRLLGLDVPQGPATQQKKPGRATRIREIPSRGRLKRTVGSRRMRG